jgi:hypothetical protein
MAGMNTIGKRMAHAAAILFFFFWVLSCTNSVNLIAEVQKEILRASAGSVVASLSGVPTTFTRATSIDITVQGQDILAYRYKLDGGSWSADTDVSQHISASGLSESAHSLSVIGKNNLGLWQEETNATTISWTVDSTPPATLNITSCIYSAAAGGIQVQWGLPAERVLILRSTASISDAPAPGVSYSLGNPIGGSTVVYAGTVSSFTDTGAGEGRKYYRAFASDLALNYAAAGGELNTVGYNGIVYVKISTGSDANPGLSTSPKASIQAGVDLANSLGIPAVHVAEGLYQKSGPVVTLKEGVSLYGGYSDADWSPRAPLTYVTTIRDTNVSAGGTFASPHHAVQAGSGITSATIVDGFTIAGATVLSEPGDIYQAGLFITGAPTIQNNVLDGGSGQALTFSGAVVVSGSSPIIQNNAIVTGKSGTNYGLYLSGSSATIRNNSIDGSNVNSNNAYGIMSTAGGSPIMYNNTIFRLYSNYTYGIRTNGGVPKILNNYIDAGKSGNSASGIYFENASTPTIINNIISGANTGQTYGINEKDSCIPAAVQNNDFVSITSPGGFYRTTSGTLYTTISALENWSSGLPFRGIACSGNTADTPVLDSAYRLMAGTPLTISRGGMILSGEGFTTDKDGATRTQPWSIGAFEYDN